MKKLLLLGIGAALLAGPAAADPVAEALGGDDNLAVIRAAAGAQACRLHYVPPAPRADGSVDWKQERYEETHGVTLDTRTGDQLRALLLSGKTYVNAGHTGGRHPQYDVRLRYQRGGDTVIVDFCLRCQVLRVWRNGAEAGGASFAGNADLIADHFARIFPADADLQALAHENH